MDDIDRAQAQEQMARDLAIRAALNSAVALPATGACHWCDSAVAGEAHFCNVECRDDFQREQAARRRRNGRTA